METRTTSKPVTFRHPAPAENPPSAGRAPVTKAADTLSFIHSRIFAQGWNAARRSSVMVAADPKKVAAANPYKDPHERARWDEGFAKGME